MGILNKKSEVIIKTLSKICCALGVPVQSRREKKALRCAIAALSVGDSDPPLSSCLYSTFSNNTEALCKTGLIILNYKNKNNFVGKYRQTKRKTNINKLVILLKIKYRYGF